MRCRSDPESVRQKKHQDLLRAATRLFAKQGIGATSTRQVAEAAKSTERTLFKHFHSKEGLVRAVIAEAVLPHLAERAVADVHALFGARADELAARHAEMLRARRAAYEANPDLTRLLLIELLRDDAVRKEVGTLWHATMWEPARAMFARLQAEGELDARTRPENLATIFYSITVGYLVGRSLLAPGAAWDDDSDAEELAHFFARGALAGSE